MKKNLGTSPLQTINKIKNTNYVQNPSQNQQTRFTKFNETKIGCYQG